MTDRGSMMSKIFSGLKKELWELRVKHGLAQIHNCSQEECQTYSAMLKNGEPLPEGVTQYSEVFSDQPSQFNETYETDLTAEEKREYLLLKQASDIKIIKFCAIFFTVVTIVSLVCSFISIASISTIGRFL